MQLKQLLNNDDAVSPVIGVILMVAITVILAAVIGTFVLGLGDQVQTTSPNAQFDWNDDGENVTLSHQSGQSVPIDDVKLTGDGLEEGEITDLNNADGNNGWTGADGDKGFPDEDISAGDSLSLGASTLSDGGEIRLVWESEGQSDTLATFDYQG